MGESYTITAQPGEWRYVNAYEGFDWGGRYDPDSSSRKRYSVCLTDTSLLPEEIANEAHVARNGNIYLSGFDKPEVEHFEGWEKLESELRRMEATNRRKDDLFENAILEITFELRCIEPRRGSRYTTPLVVLPVSLIRIVGYVA